jgi:prefoldin subunit 5
MLADIIARRDALMREIEAAQAALRKAKDYRIDAQRCLEKAQEDSGASVNIDEFISAVQAGSDIDQQLNAAGNVRDSIEHLERDVERWQRTEESCRQRIAEMERDARYFPAYVQNPSTKS